MIGIIDYDAGNIGSVIKAFASLGQECVLSRDHRVLFSADRIVLPGVGSYGACMEHLKKFDLVDTIRQLADGSRPFIGICLGLQLLFEGSEEDGGVEGLGIFKGQVKHFQKKDGYKIPHMGWNSLHISPGSRLYDGVDEGDYVYFVHSYYVDALDKNIVASTTDYANVFDSSIESGLVFGCQFHPEKSSHVGLSILSNFCKV